LTGFDEKIDLQPGSIHGLSCSGAVHCWVLRCAAVSLLSVFCQFLLFSAEFLGTPLRVQTAPAVFPVLL